jgi:hypothetical protein
VAGCSEYGDEPSGYCAKELANEPTDVTGLSVLLSFLIWVYTRATRVA